ncbi:hypothetical protein ACNQGL_07010 [Flavobacterium sp. LB3P21]|uniref:hypothetical protein n=1 Tax=Flavobacterium sp. LB3P21 TaxID=3401719 RepID=UPI003AAFD0F8
MLNNEQQKFEVSKTDTNTICALAFENKYTSVASATIEISAVLALQQNSLYSKRQIKNCLFSNSETDLLTPFQNGEAIENLIAFAIKNKKKVRAGMTTIEDIQSPLSQDNRRMIAIGG